ncbi:MAG: uracil-DNA glycosylase [Candidatus Rokubacteria bacterium]|nr:uracil-DNA glycosylase [Candidatus Rokubacteria bacterium]
MSAGSITGGTGAEPCREGRTGSTARRGRPRALAASPSPCHNPAGLQVERRLERLNAKIVRCRRCPRLVAHRAEAGARPPRRYRGERYWARPLTGFGDPRARLLLVGLAPAAHGGNRTGRMFTGDQSGSTLFDALHAAGFVNRATSERRDDGLRLRDAYITAALRCPPPGNKPVPSEIANCAPYLLDELRLLTRVRVVVGLGRIGWQAYLRARQALGARRPRRAPTFGHGAVTRFDDGVTLIASYHPSQQNTFTGRLTRGMLRAVFHRARRLLARPTPATRRAQVSRRGLTEAAGARPR